MCRGAISAFFIVVMIGCGMWQTESTRVQAQERVGPAVDEGPMPFERPPLRAGRLAPPEPPEQCPERPGMLIDAPTPQGGTERREHDNESKPEQPGVVVQDEGEPDGSNARTPEAEQREKEDLIAQQVMAEAALQMLKLTQWQIYLGIVGAILLLAALIYTARATRAAIKANEITRAAFIADQRPWLNVSLVIDSDLTLYKDVAILDVSVTIQNIGKSPATDISCRPVAG
jgi:hypothetical protein